MNILLIEHDLEAVAFFRKALEDCPDGGVRLDCVGTLAAGVRRASERPFDAILVDLVLPDCEGMESLLRLHAKVPDAAILTLTDKEDCELGVKMIQAGAQDHLVKGTIRGGWLLRVLRFAQERKRAETTFRRCDDRFLAAFEQAPVGMCLNHLDGRFMRVNSAFCDMLGYSSDELLALTFRAVAHPDDLDSSNEYAAKLLVGELESFNLEKRFIRKDGGTVWGMVHRFLLRDADRKPLHFVTHVLDFTDRKQAERRLGAMARQWQETFDAAADGICLLDRDHNILRANRAAGRIVGKTPAGLLERRCWEIFHPGTDGPIADCPTQRARLSGKREVMPIDFGRRSFEVIVDPLFDAEGRFDGAVHCVRDVTATKRVADRMGKLNQYFLTQSLDPLENITRLTGLCGESLGADCALYSRVEGENLRTVGRYQAPDDLPEVDKAEGHVCFEVFRRDREDPEYITDLPASPLAAKDANVRRYGLMTYFGKSVTADGRPIGALCVLYKRHFEPDDEDRRLMLILASVISLEEQRVSGSARR